MLGWAGFFTLSSQPPQPMEMPEYPTWSIWLWLIRLSWTYPANTATPPWNSTGRSWKWLSATSVWWVTSSATVVVGLSTSPTCRPLPDTSVNTHPRTTAYWLPLPRARPAAPRWLNSSSRKLTRCPYWTDTLPGALVQAPNGQVPPLISPHSPWVSYAPGPVSETVAWISDSPSPPLGRSQVAYENRRPAKVTSRMPVA